jgi:hypothetical protein
MFNLAEMVAIYTVMNLHKSLLGIKDSEKGISLSEN